MKCKRGLLVGEGRMVGEGEREGVDMAIRVQVGLWALSTRGLQPKGVGAVTTP